MKEFKGTPGPWRVDGLDVETEDFYVCNVGDYTLDDRIEIEVGKVVSEANANLIAAAPDLLEAMQKIVESGCVLPHLKIESQWVIAKALGESQ